MISCTGGRSQKPKKIDTSYLHSKSFQSFKRQTQEEHKLVKREKVRLASFFQEAINRMPARPLKSPVVIDSARIDQAVSARFRNPLKITLFNIEQIFHGVGWSKEGGITYYFFLTCQVNYFDNCLLWAATSINQDIKAIKTIAPYYNALPYKEIPTVRLTPPLIRVYVKRKTMYPIKQKHSFKIAYRINEKGAITRQK